MDMAAETQRQHRNGRQPAPQRQEVLQERQRGANENINGLIRQYIPKGTDFSELSDEFIAEVEWKLNNRPRKIARISDSVGIL